ncbi:hypothetical protein JXC34_06450, partial [Candidatus Woesearchaeota archaeon]|nr:hypothetical protein [Candidatus Woesearchaeota archaeon]
MSSKGMIISGKFGEIQVRQKHADPIELGELMIAENGSEKYLLQAYDLIYGSQLSSSSLELVSGMMMEEEASDIYFMDEKLRNYNLAVLKSLITLTGSSAHSSKSLPDIFSHVREVKKEDLAFLTRPGNPLYVGKLRSGSKMLDVDIFLPGEKVFSHHILI